VKSETAGLITYYLSLITYSGKFCYVLSVIIENIAAVRSRIEAACSRAGRDPSEVKLVAVSKTHPPDVIREAVAAGLSVFGENKVQEAESKIAEIGRDRLEWHLVGHLQSNKARKAVQLFDVIQSVDSVDLAQRLDRICEEEGRGELSVLIQVDLAGEATKSGIPEFDLGELVEVVRASKYLTFDGLMVLPPFFDDPDATRPYFKRLREMGDRLLSIGAFAKGRGELSMGMTNDFEVAIEEGATIIRVGTAIFGER
jgi:pyridoxal phosphate enzyme (YggS family)